MLTWEDVDLEEKVMNIKAMNTKTAKPKTVAIPGRLMTELIRLQKEMEVLNRASAYKNQHLVFRTKSNVKGSWTTARKLAGIEDVRLHDLRHTFGTRLNLLRLPHASIARSLGHRQLSTTYRYINADNTLTDSVRAAIDGFHADKRR